MNMIKNHGCLSVYYSQNTAHCHLYYKSGPTQIAYVKNNNEELKTWSGKADCFERPK